MVKVKGIVVCFRMGNAFSRRRQQPCERWPKPRGPAEKLLYRKMEKDGISLRGRLIGAGGEGRVFSASRDGETIAVKVGSANVFSFDWQSFFLRGNPTVIC